MLIMSIFISLVSLVSCSESVTLQRIPLFQAWTHMDGEGSELENLAKHQLVFSDTWLFDFGFESDNLFDNDIIKEDLEKAKKNSDALREMNPDIIVLAEIYYREGVVDEHLDNSSPYWIRNENGIVPAWGEDQNHNGHLEINEFETGLIDFTKVEIQDAVSDKAKALEATGLFDGIMLDWWSESTVTAQTIDVDRNYLTLENERIARIEILKKIRSKVDEDFLILVNANDEIVPLSAEYINGLYMECYKESFDQGYTVTHMNKIENTLLWAEKHLRTPTINCLEGWRVVSQLDQNSKEIIKERSSDENLRWMRAFTTMSLILSDGYVLFSDDNALSIADHGHNDYEFWQYDIGAPIDKYETLADHIYLRQYENARIIYNGSKEKIIYDYLDSGVKIEVNIPSLDGIILIKQ